MSASALSALVLAVGDSSVVLQLGQRQVCDG